MKRKPLPKVRETKCATCPFREGSKYADLADYLTASALQESTRICHSTGSNAINRRIGKAPLVCRGARDIQLKMFAALGVISEPTDEAWAVKWKEMESKV